MYSSLCALLHRKQRFCVRKNIRHKFKGNIVTKVFPLACIDHYRHCEYHILFLHAITGCNTSALFNRGIIKTLKFSNTFIRLRNINQNHRSPNLIIQIEVHFLLPTYGASSSQESVDNRRYMTFAKLTILRTSVQLSSSPPTNDVGQQYLFRVYYQVHTWLSHD